MRYSNIHSKEKAHSMALASDYGETRAAALRFAGKYMLKHVLLDAEDFDTNALLADIETSKIQGQNYGFAAAAPAYYLEGFIDVMNSTDDTSLEGLLNLIVSNQNEADSKADFAARAHDALESTKR